MKNKKVILLILAILVVITLVSILIVQKLRKDEVAVVNNNENINQNVNKIVEKEPEIIDGVDISDWKTYVNEEAGFTLKYPETITMSNSKEIDYRFLDKTLLSISVVDIDYLYENGIYGINKDLIDKDIYTIKMGDVNLPEVELEYSSDLVKIDDFYGYTFVSFILTNDYDDCNIFFERALVLYRNNYVVIIRLYGPSRKIIEQLPQYFMNHEYCTGRGDKMWLEGYYRMEGIEYDGDEKKDFFDYISSGQNQDIASDWYNTFDKIVETIEIK